MSFSKSVATADVVEACGFAQLRAIWSFFRNVRLDKFSFNVNGRLYLGFGLPASWSKPGRRDRRINAHVKGHIDEGQERASRAAQPSLRRCCRNLRKEKPGSEPGPQPRNRASR